ncbi:hypothetical protein [Parageobacillus thermoglucosidasius]|uniref:hypothetical protein n=1 Tax=Parageobacillus thermoglucosidasius TaxID=1426 RepID=UPI00241CA475|nr:hypothetical protein [Parageobacillus thermoglucosidasius]MBY6270166.1 hypothetical protein [Parageobacillus thermoglucosidasius]
MVWMNIDIPERKCTIHTNSCRYVQDKKETKYKGIMELKEHGGWLEFETTSKAENYQKSRFPEYRLIICKCN